MARTSTSSTPSARAAAMASGSEGPGRCGSFDITVCEAIPVTPAEARRATTASSTASRPPGSIFMRLMTKIRVSGALAYLGSFQVPSTCVLSEIPPQAATTATQSAIASALRKPRAIDGNRAWLGERHSRAILPDMVPVRGGHLALLAIEVLAQALPAAEILALQLRRFECGARRPDHVARLEHERHRVRDARRLREVGASSPWRTSPRRARAPTCSCAGWRRRA